MQTLLERAEPLAQLHAALGAGGRVLLLQGEAGVGKTSLLRRFRSDTAVRADWLFGACEPLLAPPPLAPLLELLHHLPPSLAAAVRGGHAGSELMLGMLERLRGTGGPARPVVLAIDDVQWADSATLDLLRYLGRRMAGTGALLLLAARSDPEADAVLAPLSAALPELQRITLAPLSQAAVVQLAREHGRDGAELFRITQGNPFFVSQLIDRGAGPWFGVVPAAVRDAVLARALPLTGEAREVLDLVSVSPTELPLAVLEAVFDDAAASVERCVAIGLLHQRGTAVGFRHELARKSIESALSARHAQALHAALFDALSLRGAPAARLVHHAAAGGIEAAVLRLAPLAASEAGAGGAHRQAAELLALALRHAAALPAGERAALHVAHAKACVPANRLADAVASREQALALHEAAGEPLLTAIDRCELARLLWTQGRSTAGLPHAQRAFEQLQQMPGAARECANAAATLAQLHLLDEQPDASLRWAALALPTLQTQGDTEGLPYLLSTLATATLRQRDDTTAWAQLREALALAQQHRQPEQAVRAWLNQATMGLVHHRHAFVSQAIEEGLAWCEANDVDLYAARLRIRLGYGLLAMGRLAEARPLLHALVSMPTLLPLEAEQARQVQALLQLRLGDPAAAGYWREMVAGQRRLSVDPWYAPQLIVRAEAAWWMGDLPRARQVLHGTMPVVAARGEPWRTGQLMSWMQRVGLAVDLEGMPPDTAAPLRAELEGRLHDAAAAWDGMGCRWEALMVRLAPAACDATLLRQALAIATEIGAEPAAALARRRLRALGEDSGPRQPRRTTRADPLGLTPREREVLALLAAGLSNQQIGQRLVRSERTVEKHVAALLDKLGVTTRAEAAAKAARLPTAGENPPQN
jgi:DNA-binding CsgD family transcriptional regulator